MNDLWEYQPGSFGTAAATPTFSPGTGTYSSAQTVTISDSTPGATIYYSLNGAATTSSTPYTGPITIGLSETINAIAVATGYGQSATGTAVYTINLAPTAAPTFSVPAGTYTSTQTVTMADTTSGASIYYTTDGSTPNTSSTRYSGAITVTSSETINAIAVAAGYSQSTVAAATYIINFPPAASPMFSPAAGTYTSTQTVTISDATSGATIYFTTDGSMPTTSSTQYNSPIAVSSSETLSAVAVAAGYSQSTVAAAVYTITPPAATPTYSVAAGNYTSTQSVTISDATSGATIYYTTNGSTPTTSSSQYSGAISVSSSETINAIAIASGYSQSAVGTAAYVINLPPAASPTFTPVGGTYTSTQTVSISDSTGGASIYFTTDGSTPTSSSTKYSGAITVSSSETIKAIAMASGYSSSGVAAAAYTITPPAATPTFSVAAGTYTSTQAVTISDATSGATIYYTTNGSTPTTSSTQYSSPITVSSSETLSAIAVATGYSQSAVASAAFTISPPAATPTFSVAAGTYTSVQTVTISDATAGAIIYYTTNGTAPTTSSTVYSGPITVSSTETLEAIATVSGYTQSNTAVAAYTINLPLAAPPTFAPGGGTYTSSQTVTISDATPGANIYFTTNGTTPTTSSSVYSSPIAVSSTGTIKAFVVASGYNPSAVSTVTYTITPPATAPTFSPAGGTYTSAQTVTISDATPGASIYYTRNGSAPTTSSALYTGAIIVNASETINAMAVAAGYSQSLVGTAAYTISLPAPTFQLSVNPTTLTIVAGHSGNATFTVTPQNGFNSPVNFACSGLPSESSCSFNPAPVTPNGAPVTSTLTITTTASNAATLQMPASHVSSPVYAILLPSFGVLVVVSARRRRLLRDVRFFTLLGLMALSFGLVACGVGNHIVALDLGTPAGSYTISVSATSSSGGGASNGPATLAVTVSH